MGTWCILPPNCITPTHLPTGARNVETEGEKQLMGKWAKGRCCVVLFLERSWFSCPVFGPVQSGVSVVFFFEKSWAQASQMQRGLLSSVIIHSHWKKMLVLAEKLFCYQN